MSFCKPPGGGSDNNLEFPESSAAVETNSGLAHARLEEKVKNPTKLLRNTNSLNRLQMETASHLQLSLHYVVAPGGGVADE